MADYTGTTWVDDDGSGTVGTVFSATKMNAIEAGIQDAAQHNKRGALASRPAAAAGNKNWLYFATDDRGGTLWHSNGSSWVEARGAQDDILADYAQIAALPAHGRSGDVLTASANGALSGATYYDGATISVGMRVLNWLEAGVGSQAIDHGVYEITAVGSAGTPWVMTRVSDMNTATGVSRHQRVRVAKGTLYGRQTFYCETQSDGITLNSTGTEWGMHPEGKRTVTAGVGFGTGWADFGAGALLVRYWRENGHVYIHGGAKRTSGTGTTIFTLPVGFRPVDGVQFPCAVFGGIETVTVAATGVVASSGSAGAAVVTLLDPIHFPLDA